MWKFLIGILCLFPVSLFGAETKNIIWVIGDGMGLDSIGFFTQGVRYGHLPQYEGKEISDLENLLNHSVWGLFFNNTYDTLVTDSAAAATQMATGAWSRPKMVGLDYDGQPVKTLLEEAREKGKAVGLISDAYVTDATPAAFVAHVKKRENRYEIARQLVSFGPDVVLGGGLKYFTENENKTLLAQARQQGYHIAQTRSDLAKINEGKVLGLFAEQALPLTIEMNQSPEIPTLLEQTTKALSLLEQQKTGFILLVEVGKIDWAAHANDAGALFQEMQVMDALAGYLKNYIDAHPDTLLYINADHDTGLVGFQYRHLKSAQVHTEIERGKKLYGGDKDYASFDVYQQFVKQKHCLYYVEKELKAMAPKSRTRKVIAQKLSDALGYEVDMSQFTDLTDISGIFKTLNTNRGLVFATENHTSLPILSIAYGAGAESFGGVYHNTDILSRMQQVLNWRK